MLAPGYPPVIPFVTGGYGPVDRARRTGSHAHEPLHREPAGLEFNLFEFLDTKDRFGTGPFAQMDAETARGVLAEIRRLAEGPIAESFTNADRNPPVFDPATQSVTLPESFKRSVRAIEDGDWFTLDLPEHLGGFGAPHALTWAAFEMVLGANPAVFM